MRVAGSMPDELTLMLIWPGSARRLCTMAMQRPLKALRSVAWSGSWQLGSPLPTPMTAPGPVTANATLLFAVGTGLPCASTICTLTTVTSWPSAVILVRSAVATIFAAGPLVSRFSVSVTRLFLLARASMTPGAYFTFQTRWPFFFTGCEPRLAPLRKSSTES